MQSTSQMMSSTTSGEARRFIISWKAGTDQSGCAACDL